MADAARTLPSALLPTSQEDAQTESILSILGRIYDERGPFRHITEKSLEAELAADSLQETSSDSEEDEDDVAEVDELEGKTRPEQLFAKKTEMLSLLMPVQNEAMILLDLMSLVASKDLPKQAEMTMSPALKQQLKPGMLSFDMWNNMPNDREQQETDETIARGWRMQSLQASADSLLGAATRLEKDVRRETRYWDQVLSVSERGWSLCRMPREKHNLGVRFGFIEAQGEYRDRGLAALRADESGNVILDKGLGNSQKSIRVRTNQGSLIVGVSKMPSLPAESELTLETRIRAARDSLYEEELFHEITRESRTLAAYGVDMPGSTISLPTRLDSRPTRVAQSGFDHVLIDLISPDDANKEEPSGSPQDSWAQAIAVAFRLLLSYTHRERLKRRSDLPPPMSLGKRDAPVAHILRPILTLLHHHSISKDMDHYLGRLNSLLTAASVDASVRLAQFETSHLKQAESMGSLMRNANEPLHSQSSLSLRIPGRTEALEFELHLHTSSSAPTLGSKIVLNSPIGASDVIELDDTEDLVGYLDELVADALAQGIAASLPSWNHSGRIGVVSNPVSGRKVKVQVRSGILEEEQGQVVLNTSTAKVNWGLGSEDSEKQQFWDVVGGIE